MSEYRDELQNLAQLEDAGERLASAARLDALFDAQPDLSEDLTAAQEERDRLKTERDALAIERDEFRDKYVSMYFTSPEEIKRAQADDIRRDARPEGIETLFKFRQGY